MVINRSLALYLAVLLAGGGLFGAANPLMGQQREVDGFPYPLQLEARTYKMVSVPFELERDRFRDVFEDDFGPYSQGTWRLFHYNTLRATFDEYFDLEEEPFEPGTAVWLITRDGAPFDIYEDGDDVSVPSETVIIEAFTGWNQVGNPFDFPIPCSDLLEEARQQPAVLRIEGPVFFDGAEYQYNIDVCQPYEGYFIYLETTLPVFPVPVPPVPVGPEASERPIPIEINAESEYVLQIAATVPGIGLHDTQNYVGLLRTARTGLDKHDFREAPPIGDPLHLSIVDGTHRFAGNFKPAQGAGQQWDLIIEAPRTHQPVEVILKESGRLPEGFMICVLDRDRGVVVPLHGNGFQAQPGEDGRARHFTLLLGTEAYIRAQSLDLPLASASATLWQNHPNPFNPETVIQYRLGQHSLVVLDIYDLRGRRIRRLVEASQQEGIHEVRWDGRDAAGLPVASGLFLYRLQAGAFTDAKTMILMR